MKTIFTSLFLVTVVLAFAQTSINKTIAVQAEQKIRMNFDYPKVIKVTTWSKNEISITGEISINAGENDDAFSIESSSSGNEVTVTGEIRNLKDLPHRVTVWHDGQKMTFKTKADYKKYADVHERNHESMNFGADIEILLEIKVPENMQTQVLSTYGTIEIINFTGPLTAESTYGGVDAALNEKSIGELKVETGYGQFYTNFDFKFTGKELGDFHSVVNAKPGKGPSYNFESKYGNVYLRKAL